MARAKRRRKCRNCGDLFWPDPRNVNKQKYCSELDCRKASKRAAQRRWSVKKRNRNYFKGAVHVSRVQEWRKQHPGYWRRTCSALQDHSTVKSTVKHDVNSILAETTLQDHINAQHAVIIGLISHLTGNTLQDHIASTTRNMQQLGQDILNTSPQIFYGGDHENKEPDKPRPDP